jgi:hypothetical protein
MSAPQRREAWRADWLPRISILEFEWCEVKYGLDDRVARVVAHAWEGEDSRD